MVASSKVVRRKKNGIGYLDVYSVVVKAGTLHTYTHL